MLTKPPVPFNQEKALLGAFSVITNLRMELFQALVNIVVVVCIMTVSRAAPLSQTTQLLATAAVPPPPATWQARARCSCGPV